MACAPSVQTLAPVTATKEAEAPPAAEVVITREERSFFVWRVVGRENRQSGVAGALLVMFIRGLALLARTIASAAKQVGHTLIMLYDVIIFLPLVIERGVKLSFGPRVAALPASSKSGDVAAFPKRSGSASGDHSL